jgi:hypothetical protein
MTFIIFADAAALTAPVVFVSLFGVVTLLIVRALGEVLRVQLSRFVSRMLDGSIVAVFLVFLTLVVIRFRIIG